MGFLTDWIEEFIKGLLINGIFGNLGITDNLGGLFDNVNNRVGEIATTVGTPPAAWNVYYKG